MGQACCQANHQKEQHNHQIVYDTLKDGSEVILKPVNLNVASKIYGKQGQDLSKTRTTEIVIKASLIGSKQLEKNWKLKTIVLEDVNENGQLNEMVDAFMDQLKVSVLDSYQKAK